MGLSIVLGAGTLAAWLPFPLTFAGLALATVGLTVLSPTYGRAAQYFLWSAFWALAGAVALSSRSIDISMFVRAGVAALCFGWASGGLFPLIANLRGRDRDEAFGRGMRVRVIGYVVAGCLIGAAALKHGHASGFIAAYGAFSFAWVFYCAAAAFRSKESDRLK